MRYTFPSRAAGQWLLVTPSGSLLIASSKPLQNGKKDSPWTQSYRLFTSTIKQNLIRAQSLHCDHSSWEQFLECFWSGLLSSYSQAKWQITLNIHWKFHYWVFEDATVLMAMQEASLCMALATQHRYMQSYLQHSIRDWLSYTSLFSHRKFLKYLNSCSGILIPRL